MGPTCEFCARYGARGQQQAPQPWQPPAWQPPQYAPAYQGGGYTPTVDTGINPLELGWARTRVMWAWIAVGGVGVLTLAAYWLISSHPETVAQLALSLLLSGGTSSSSQRTELDIIQLIVYFVLSFLPLAGVAIHQLMSQPQTGLDALAQAADLKPLFYQAGLYVLLAVLIWRRSIIALTVATLLFLADSGVYTYGLFKVLQGLWELNQKFAEMVQQSPSLGTLSNPYDIGRWPWGLVLPIVIRAALLWMLVSSFSGMRLVRLDRARRKAAALAEAEAQAA